MKLYYKPKDGEAQEFDVPQIDANDAVRRFPEEYSLTPWPEDKPAAAPEPEHPKARHHKA